jgi:hypothetical protein
VGPRRPRIRRRRRVLLPRLPQGRQLRVRDLPRQHQRHARPPPALGQVHVLHVPTSSQYANIFTNRLPTAIFTAFSQHLAARRCA